MTFVGTRDFIGGADLPGELADLPGELDLLPDIGGCGQALYMAALVLTGKADPAQGHLDGCAACRLALAPVGDAERSASALAFFSTAGQDMTTGSARYAARTLAGAAA